MEGIILETLPTWIPGLVMIYTGIIWLVTRKFQIRMESRVLAYTLISWGMFYLISYFSPSDNPEYLVGRVFMSRIIIILICLSQSVPMTVSYIKAIRRAKDGQ